MPDLWDSGGPSLPSPSALERDRPGRDGPSQTPAQAPQIDWDATGLSRAVADPIAFGLNGAYGSAWQQDYGTIAGRTLTGAAPAEAFPDATTPERQQYRDALAHILSPGQQGADHPDAQAVLRGALADGMTRTDRAVVNRAAINAAVERDPRALLEIGPEVPERHLAAWSALARHRIPQSVRNDLRQINENYRTDSVTAAERAIFGSDFVRPPGNWRVRSVESANGPEVNLDYYSVTVQQMPPGVSPGALLNSVRKNLNHYVDSSLSSFSAYPNENGVRGNTGTEDGAWQSNRPLGSLVQIDIPGNPGVVMVTDVAEDHWTFSTVQTPDDRHPVSGNRQLGYTENDDGSVTFYTRGVDRITNTLGEFANDVSKIRYGSRGIAFTKADQLWRSFQQGLVGEINARGGEARVGETISVQPPWAEYERALVGQGPVTPVIRGDRR